MINQEIVLNFNYFANFVNCKARLS